MQYFSYLTQEERDEIFYLPPEEINKDAPKNILANALGATLYVPSTNERIAADIINGKINGLMSLVLCLEDAIGDNKVKAAEQSLVRQLTRLQEALDTGEMVYRRLPLLFVRVRNGEQMGILAERAGRALDILTGFVFPKFTSFNGLDFFQVLTNINNNLGTCLYGMPILETGEVIYREARAASLEHLQQLLAMYQEPVLNLRVGGTDFSSLFGLRRSYQVTIYDIGVIRDCITDIINTFARVERGYVVSAPVWEYFSLDNSEELIREVLLDKANGLTGKTIIHPSHILPVQALYVVNHEEYMDARSILLHNNGEVGAIKSPYANKMNEIKPHLNWAKKTMLLAKIYGVFHEQQDYRSLLAIRR